LQRQKTPIASHDAKRARVPKKKIIQQGKLRPQEGANAAASAERVRECGGGRGRCKSTGTQKSGSKNASQGS